MTGMTGPTGKTGMTGPTGTTGAAILGTARLRTILATALCVLPGAVLLWVGFQILLPLPGVLLLPTLWAHLAGAGLMVLSVAITAWVTLWPATPYLDLRPGDAEPRGAEPREAKAAALSFPSRVATAGTSAGELGVAAGWLALTVSGQALTLSLAMCLTTAVLVGLCWLLIHTLAQQAVAPLLTRLREVGLPQTGLPHGVSLRGRLAYTLFIVVVAGLISATLFADAYLTRAQEQLDRAHQAAAARWLREAVVGLDRHSAQLMSDGLSLSQGALTLVPPPTLSPQYDNGYGYGYGDGDALRGAPMTVTLPGGKTVYVPLGGPAERPVGMVLAMAVLLALTAAIAFQMSRLVDADIAGLLAQVRELCQAQAGQVLWRTRAEPPQTAEAQQVAAALSRLMDRMRRLHVESYLAIERTIDARRAKSQFLASMSHDLRSPLSSVLGFSELLTSGYEGEIPEAAARRLDHMHRTGRRLLRLLSEILDSAKVESQTIELHPRLCAPGDLLSQAVAEARRGRMQEDVPVVLQIMPGLRPVHVDPLRFPQALAHLIGHVLDGAVADTGFAKSDGPANHGQVVVSAREGRSAPGSPPGSPPGSAPGSAPGSSNDRGPVFEVEVEHIGPRQPLATVGLGLALPLARRLIALHGGTIEVTPGSRPGSHQALRAIVPMRPQ